MLEQKSDLLHNRRVGVVSSPSGVLPDLTSSAEALLQVADVRALFGPEHGLLGAADAGEHVDASIHPSGVPIYSLYGDNLAPTAEQLADLDVIVFDTQDVGCRFYTYAWSLVLVMKAAAAAGVSVIVADRPNPIGGAVEGPGVQPAQRTLVGLHDVPIRHGLTIGELALLVNAELAIDCDVAVIRCEGWRRGSYWEATGLPWVAPSPNMPTVGTAVVYPGTCLMEGMSVSVGRSTAMPFEWQGAPWVDASALANNLNALKLPGVRWRPVAFKPAAGPYANQQCFGAQPHVLDRSKFRPVLSGFAMVTALWRMGQERSPEHDRIHWNTEHFDRLAGTPDIRIAIEAGATPAELAADWPAYEQQFRERAAPFLLY